MASVMIVAVSRLIYDFLTLEICILSCFWRFQSLEMRFLMLLHDCDGIGYDCSCISLDIRLFYTEICILSCFWHCQTLEMRFLLFKCSLLAILPYIT